MKKIIYLLFAGCISLFMMSCEGPAGKDGVDGAPGEPGEPGADMDATCLVCHNSTTSTLNAIMDQFEESAHSNGTYYDRNGQCAACHNTEGFLARADYTSIAQIDDFTGAKSAISCYTCHNIHTDYALSDFALTNTSQVTETIFGYKDGDTYTSISFADYGNGNLCLQCHQARDRGNVPAADATGDVTTGSTHWGPHYGVQGNVLQASGGVHVGTGYPSSTGGHAGIADACIACHMEDGSHTLEVGYDGCATCHTAGDADDKVKALHTEIDALKHELGKLLAAQGVASVSTESEWIWDDVNGVHVEVIDTVGFGPKNMTMTADQAKALYNYMVVYQDHSYGVHNPTYIRTLLNNSIALITP